MLLLLSWMLVLLLVLLDGLDAIPNLPHIVIVPNSLNNQWYLELRTFFAPKAVEIYKYPTAENEFGDFFNGPWAASATPLIHRIILVNHSVINTSGKVFDTRKGVAGHNSNKASDDARSVKQHKQAAKCLWAGRKFLTVSIDEVHEMHNLTAGFYATLEVTKASIVKLLASGTPLYTGPMEDKSDAAAHTICLMAGGSTNDVKPEARLCICTAMTLWITNIKRGYFGSMAAALDDGASFNMSLTEWDKVRSTKVDTLIKVLGWQLESNMHHIFKVDKEDAMTEAGGAAKVPNAQYVAMPDLMTRGMRKILVYIEFPMMAPLLISVLKLHKIIPLVIHGGHSVDEWNETVQKFHSDPKARILIFSSVGAVGLNLTVASIIDQCWLCMLVNQIIRHAWRLGQQKEVIVYNMVALGTVDVLMVHHGEGKGNMLGQFLSANKGIIKTIKSTAAGHAPIKDDNDDKVQVIETPVVTQGPSKPWKKAAKGGKKSVTRNIAQTGDEDGEILNLDNMVLNDKEEEEDGGTGKGKGKAKDKGKAPAKPKPKPKPKPKGKGKGKATVDDEASDDEGEVVEPDTQNKPLTPLSKGSGAASAKAQLTSSPLTELPVIVAGSSSAGGAGVSTLGDTAVSSTGPQRELDTQSTMATPPASASETTPMADSMAIPSGASHTDGPHGELESQTAGVHPDTKHPAGATQPASTAPKSQNPQGDDLDIDPSSINKGTSAETSMPDANKMDHDLGNDGDHGADNFSSPDLDSDVQMDSGSSSVQNRAAVDRMLPDLTQSESNQPSSSQCPSPPDIQVIQTSQATQDLQTVPKHRRTGSSANATPRRPPYAPSPPHKHVNFLPSNPSSLMGSPEGSSRGSVMLRNRSAVPDDAPGPQGRGGFSRAGRGHGGWR
ncbi:hypothetical protein BDR05DRAFT_952938 [Suillus weaverae]|nr:hypothetical protein BDR05DRAFT_952938 [Suillus weaverae]